MSFWERDCDEIAEHSPHYWFGDYEPGGAKEYICTGAKMHRLQPAAASSAALGSLPLGYRSLAKTALERFAEAYAEYGDSSRDETGLAGQWADLYRKVMKLKAPFWNGEMGRLTRESEREVLQDLIGHALLALGMLEDGKEGGR